MLKQVSGLLDPAQCERLFAGLDLLERNTRDLQEAVIGVRMLPVDAVFRRFPRLVRDLSARLGKQVRLRTIGEGTELDKGLIERIADPLVHLVRNSIDHGLELPEARREAGKDETGTITLAASHQGGHIVIEVSVPFDVDDGPQRLAHRARSDLMRALVPLRKDIKTRPQGVNSFAITGSTVGQPDDGASVVLVQVTARAGLTESTSPASP